MLGFHDGQGKPGVRPAKMAQSGMGFAFGADRD
jgi:hypothetical protein